MSPPPELPESHTCPFCGLAWTDTPAKSQTNSLKATFWGHVLRDPPNPGEDTSGTFSLQSLMGGTDHQNAPRLLPAPMPWGGGGGGRPPCRAAQPEVLARNWWGVGSSKPQKPRQLCFSSRVCLNQTERYYSFSSQAQNLHPDYLSQKAQAASF